MPIDSYYSTTEAAALLGLAPGSVRDAVRRGALAVVQVAGRNLVSAAEVARYQREVQGTHGWETRKTPTYRPNEKQRTYQQTYYQRRKEARREEQE